VKQNKPWLPTAILAGVAVLLAAFAIWVVPQLGEPPQGDKDQPEPIIFFAFQGQDVVRISVTQGFMIAVVERSGLEWRIVEPTASMADSVRLDTLADSISRMRSVNGLEGVALSDFGLSESAAQVNLELVDGSSVLFSIGDENPGRTGRYVQRAGDSRVHVVPNEYVSGLLEMTINPPYPATPAPPPSPIETPAPETDDSLTPEAEDEPTPEATESATIESTESPTIEATDSPTPTP
jgi:hypothetical protein